MTSLISKAIEEWVEPHVPEKKVPEWLQNLADTVHHLLMKQKKSVEVAATTIREEFLAQDLGKPSQVKYMSYLKSLLLENGTLLNPDFPPYLQQVSETHFNNSTLVDLFQTQHSHYARWRLFRHLQYFPGIDGTLFERHQGGSYLRRDFWVNCNLISKTLWNEVQQMAKQRQMTRPEIKIEDKELFLEQTLAGLKEYDDPSKLFPALLLACGRRPSTLHCSIDDRWQLLPTPSSKEKKHQILFKERLKKRGRLLPGDPWMSIPLLCSPRQFLRSLRMFQKRHHQKDVLVTESNAEKLYGVQHRQWCLNTGLKPRDFRAVYAAYIARDAAVRDGVTVPAAVSRALLHVDTGSATNYLRVDLES